MTEDEKQVQPDKPEDESPASEAAPPARSASELTRVEDGPMPHASDTMPATAMASDEDAHAQLPDREIAGNADVTKHVEAEPAPSPKQKVAASGDAMQDDAETAAPEEPTDADVRAESQRYTRRAFAVGAGAAAAGFGLYHWLGTSMQQERQPLVLRKAFEANASIARAVFNERGLAPTYALKHAGELRVNGVYGLKKMLQPESYRLQLVGMRDAAKHPAYTSDVTAWEYRYVDEQSHEDQGHDTKIDPAKTDARMSSVKMASADLMDRAMEDEQHTGRKPRGMGEAGESYSTIPRGTAGVLLTMHDLLRLPRHELVTQFKCIEGWSQVVHWAGVRMADFLEAYPPEPVQGREPAYVYMETPDGDYYNGYDMAACRHPQTLLVTEMMGQPLTQFHGAPLRIHMPIKYGYKQIKRIGLIHYTDRKPDDYWTKLGYDWYAGL